MITLCTGCGEQTETAICKGCGTDVRIDWQKSQRAGFERMRREADEVILAALLEIEVN